MRARDVMTTPAITISPATPLKKAAELLARRRINGAPVVGPSGELLGMVTEADLLRLEIAQEPSRRILVESDRPKPRRAEDMMVRDIVSVQPSTELSALARAMVENHLKTIPIVESGRVVGVVSRRDIIQTFVRSDDEIRDEIQDLLDEEIIVLGRFKADVQQGVVTLHGKANARTERLVDRLVRSVSGVIGVDRGFIHHTRQSQMGVPL